VNVEFHPDVYKQLQRLPRSVFAAALDAIIALARDPRPPGVKKLAGSRDDWRVRIGEYRIVYQVDDRLRTVTVMRVAHRRESYR
jgi:mRNA interferase RelE/StbE